MYLLTARHTGFGAAQEGAAIAKSILSRFVLLLFDQFPVHATAGLSQPLLRLPQAMAALSGTQAQPWDQGCLEKGAGCLHEG